MATSRIEGSRTSWQEHHLCGSCQFLGHCRIGIRKWIEGRTACGEVSYGPEHMGGPGVIHGGWAAMVFDEVCGLVPLAHDLPPAVTRTLTVNYIKPVPIERLLSVQARLVKRRGRDLEIHGALRLGQNGTPLATTTAIFTAVSTDHFDRHAVWLASQSEAPTERSGGVGR